MIDIAKQLKTENNIRFYMSCHIQTKNWSPCGRIVDVDSGFFVDLFKWRNGIGEVKSNSRAPYRGGNKGCWRGENKGEMYDNDFQTPACYSTGSDCINDDGGSSFVHKLFVKAKGVKWWVQTIRKQRLLPLQLAQYKGVSGLYVPNDPIGAANGEYGNCAKWTPLKTQFAIYAWPNNWNVLSILALGGVGCLLLIIHNFLANEHWLLVPSHLLAAMVMFSAGAVFPLCCTFLFSDKLRSGYASVSMCILAAGTYLLFNYVLMHVMSNKKSKIVIVLSRCSSITLFWSLLPFYSMLNMWACQMHQNISMSRCGGGGIGHSPHFGQFAVRI